MTKETLGSVDPCFQPASRRYEYFTGETYIATIEGEKINMAAFYALQKTYAPYNHSIDSIDYDESYGKARVRITYIEDGNAIYELFANDIYKAVESHPYFEDLTPLQILTVRDAVENGTQISGSGKDAELWELLARGTEEYLIAAYVLRESYNTSSRSTRRAAYSGVNTVESPPTPSNPIIGDLPSGEWLKKAPNVYQVGAKMWRINQEYWWATKWSAILYGGTGSP